MGAYLTKISSPINLNKPYRVYVFYIMGNRKDVVKIKLDLTYDRRNYSLNPNCGMRSSSAYNYIRKAWLY